MRLVASDEVLDIRELSGGVSNIVLYVGREDGADFVLKQARPQLRVPDPWFCSVERIWREVAVMKRCRQVLTTAGADKIDVQIPDVLFEDRENYLFAMAAAPAHHVWKQQLLSGEADVKVAGACGRMLGRLHAATWHDGLTAEEFADQQFFVDLRVDPYYRRIANVHEDLQPTLSQLIESVQCERHALVHGDFSPKNLLVWESGLMLVDFEVGHYGDPAFDLGFFLSHLVLKAFYAAPSFEPLLELADEFWKSYSAELGTLTEAETLALESRAVMNLAGCALARVDGKSKVEYLQSELQTAVRRLCRSMLRDPPSNWAESKIQIHAQLINL